MTLSMNVRYEIENDRAKFFVNDVYVGAARSFKHQGKNKLLFRCSENPWRNFIPNIPDYVLEDPSEPIEKILKDSYVLPQLVPVVIRNYMRNYLRHNPF